MKKGALVKSMWKCIVRKGALGKRQVWKFNLKRVYHVSIWGFFMYKT